MSTGGQAFKDAVNRALTQIQRLEATVSDFSGDQDALNKELQGYSASLDALAAERERLNVEVPVELLGFVDGGGNPDELTTEFFRRADRANQIAKGKAAAFEEFRSALLSEAEKAFPEEAAAYAALKAPKGRAAGGPTAGA